jgi:uncharacterized protein (DUF1778 family)
MTMKKATKPASEQLSPRKGGTSIIVLLTVSQKKKLRLAAEACGLGVSVFVRMAALNEAARGVKEE